jgi:hypothetical protein
MESAKRLAFNREGKSPAFDLISKSRANLIRMWTGNLTELTRKSAGLFSGHSTASSRAMAASLPQV